MSESNVRSLILLTTGRRKDLVFWEIKNQADYAGIPLLSMTSISNGSTVRSNDVVTPAQNIPNGKENSSENIGPDSSKFKELLFRVCFDCSPADIDILKKILGNCILLRSAYEEAVAEAIGTDQLWTVLAEMDLVSSVSSKYLLSSMCAPEITSFEELEDNLGTTALRTLVYYLLQEHYPVPSVLKTPVMCLLSRRSQYIQGWANPTETLEHKFQNTLYSIATILIKRGKYNDETRMILQHMLADCRSQRLDDYTSQLKPCLSLLACYHHHVSLPMPPGDAKDRELQLRDEYQRERDSLPNLMTVQHTK
jgi:hypothetical protein